VSDERWNLFIEREARLDRNHQRLNSSIVRAPSGAAVAASQLLKQPGQSVGQLRALGVQIETDPEREAIDLTTVETAIKYEGYLRRQQSEIERARRDERRRIPQDFPFGKVPGLTRESVQRLEQVRPDSLGQALRIPGLTPAAVAVLSAYVGRLGSEGSLS